MAAALNWPTGPRGRALALGLTGAALAVVWLAVGAPLLDSYDGWSEANARRADYARAMLEVTRRLPELRAAAARRGPDTTAALLVGDTDAVAGAALDQAVGTMATAAGAQVASSEVLPSEAAGGYRRIALRVNVGGSWPVLVRLLQHLSRASPRIFVDDIGVHAQPVSDKERVLPIDTTLTLVGFRNPAAAAPAAAAPAKPLPPAESAPATPSPP